MTIATPSRALATAVDSAEAGREVFRANCAMCHGDDAAGMMGVHPSLRGAVERLSLEGVEVTVRQGRDVSPPMPAFADELTEEQIADVVAYIASLPVGPRNFGRTEEMMGGDGMMMDGGMSGLWLLLWALFALVLITLAAFALVWLVQNLRGGGRRSARHAGDSSARDKLDRRYAAGELSRDDYLQRRQDMES
ncbi:MAG: cytochrome c [Actinomycetota bacterium]|nr:cytochrome c [Actinomycetota bacterium]